MGDESPSDYQRAQRAYRREQFDRPARQLRRFDGVTYEHGKDGVRLSGQLDRVAQLMADGHWRTLAQIAAVVGGTEASVSARLRDLRKPKFGGATVERARLENGLWKYRLAPKAAP